jgi:hypothetical protein
MSDTPAPQQTTDVRREGERGASLIFALFGLSTLTILGLGLTSVGIIATRMTTNERDTQEALALADAGASHARKMVMYQEWPTNNLTHLMNGGDAVACTGDELSQAPAGAPAPYPTVFVTPATAGGTLMGNGNYRVFVCDDHLTDVDNQTGILDPNPDADVNRRILVRSIGTTTTGSTAAIEQVYMAVPVPALLVNGNVSLQGNTQISGQNGSVHANGNITVVGNSVCAQENFSATATITGTPAGGATCNQAADKLEGSAPVNIRNLNPGDYQALAQIKLSYVLVPQGGGGNMNVVAKYYIKNAGVWVAQANGAEPAGWTFNGNAFKWSTNGNMPQSVYYVETHVSLGGNVQAPPPAPGNTPAQMTIFAEGSIEVGGGAKVVSHPTVNLNTLPTIGPVALLAGQDIDMAGNGASGATTFSGLVYCRHQIEITGTPSLNGQVVALNVADTDFPMPAPPGANQVNPDNPVPLQGGLMVVSGTPNITFNGAGLSSIAVRNWRECRFDPATFNAATNDPCGPLSF